MTLQLIGLHGHAQVGKDTFAEFLHDRFGFSCRSFAGPVKAATAAAFGFDPYIFNHPENKEKKDKYWNLSPRECAQLVGTELFREYFGADFWVRRIAKNLPLSGNVVITDARFQNECDWITQHMGGIVIHITRPGYEGKVGIKDHASESGVNFSLPHYKKGVNYFELINDGSYTDLQAKANNLMNHIMYLPSHN